MRNVSRIGPVELELLRFIAKRHPVKAREVIEFAAEQKGLARTTVLTTLERLRKKGHLSRRKVDGVFQYETRGGVTDLLRRLVGVFVEGVLAGSLAPFTAYLTSAKGFDEQEIAELEKIVSELKRSSRSDRS